ncbi:mitochondrial inner membrane protease ATP23 homolog [Tubulanus polymorphus]|uniref:mitochondrial inner membrane protease ATP23 homolog n=1 Tax=Tubulanus polymorphus TaxID=672921 RepID=UPI003DA5F191
MSRNDERGYHYYPERHEQSGKSTLSQAMEGRGAANHVRCANNVGWCLKNNPMIKILVGAMKKHGCEIDLARHVSCENCEGRVTGGYDPETNQVVICQNNATKPSTCCSVLGHEFVHAFDACRAKVNFDNLEHLACTEIRAANLMHCSFMTAWLQGDSSVFGNIKQSHQECIKRKAVTSVIMVRNCSEEKARNVVDKVFDKCYNDMEPIGRRCRRNSKDPENALTESYLYGYSD